MIAGIVVVATALSGCASSGPDSGAAPAPAESSGGAVNPTAEPSPSGFPRISVPGNPVKPSAGEITVTGEVEYLDIEGGCLVLRVGPQAYQLMGVDRETAQPGRRLTVRGRVRTDVATICQVGPVLEAIETRPA